MSSPMRHTMLDTPIGAVRIAGDDDGLRSIDLRPRGATPKDWIDDRRFLRDAVEQLEAYFAGKLREFDLRLAPVGTEFQRRCWRALCDIPYGATISYGEQARRLGDAHAARAAGAANGANPLPIVIPCHRVIGADGSLVGFGGGLRTKRMLLDHEATHVGLFAEVGG